MTKITLVIRDDFVAKLRELDQARATGTPADVLRIYDEIGPSAIGLIQVGLLIEREREEIKRAVAQ